jgi:hypothetical protein
VTAFFKRLAGVGTVDSKALAFTILTLSRTSEVIGAEAKPPATWREIGEEDGKPVWLIGSGRMKARRKHVVPLTAQMVALEVRSVGHTGLDLLTLSSSHFDPTATWAARVLQCTSIHSDLLQVSLRDKFRFPSGGGSSWQPP